MVSRVTTRNATRQSQNVPSEWHQSLEERSGVPGSCDEMRTGALDDFECYGLVTTVNVHSP